MRIGDFCVECRVCQKDQQPNTYDEARSTFFNRGKLTTASRTVPAQTVASTRRFPQMNVTRQFDHDAAGRLCEGNPHQSPWQQWVDRTLATAYWPDGSLKTENPR